MDQTTAARIEVNVGVSGAEQLTKVEAGLKGVEAAGKKTKDSVAQLSTATTTMDGAVQKSTVSLGGMASKFIAFTGIVALATKALKDTYDLTRRFDDAMDKLAFQSGKTGAEFKRTSVELQSFATSVSDGTIFSMDKVAQAMGKLRDRGFDVYTMTKEQLAPVLAAATVTGEELASVADAAGAAMQAFGLHMSDLPKIADLQAIAFREAALSSQEFADSLASAGAVAAATGGSIESYMAVIVRLKQLGQNGDQFQKLFYSAMENPSAAQLRSMDRAGLQPYASASSFSQKRLLQQGIAGAAGAGASFLGTMGLGALARPLTNIADSAGGAASATAQMQEQAQRGEDLRRELIALANEQDRLNATSSFYAHLLDANTLHTKALTATNYDYKESLKGLGEQIGTTKERMTTLQGKLQNMLDPNVSGLAPTKQYTDAIKTLNTELKDHERALEGTKQKYETLSASLQKAQTRVQTLQQKMNDLRSSELVGEQGFNDQEFALQQQIAAKQLQKSQLAPYQMFEGNALDQQIAQLQQQLQQTQLQRTLTIDPEKKRIDDAMRAADGTTPTTADAVIAGIGATDAQLERAQKKERRAGRAQRSAGRDVEAQQADIDAISSKLLDQQAALDTAMQANAVTLEEIRTKAHAAMQALGLEEGPMSKEQLLNTIDSIHGEYGNLQTRLGLLTGEQHKQESALAANEKQLDLTKLAGEGYKTTLDGIQQKAAQLKETIGGKEEEFGGINKPLKDQIQILKDIAASSDAVGLAYDLFGKRAAGGMIALVGDGGKGIGLLEQVRSKMNDVNVATQGAADALDDAIGKLDILLAKKDNALIETGSALNEGDAPQWVKDVTNATGIGLIASWLGDWSVEKHATGGIVGGRSGRDMVPAMLTRGEEVLPESSPRHIKNGGGGIQIHFNAPVSIRSDQDIKRLASAISREIAGERARVRSGMPA